MRIPGRHQHRGELLPKLAAQGGKTDCKLIVDGRKHPMIAQLRLFFIGRGVVFVGKTVLQDSNLPPMT